MNDKPFASDTMPPGVAPGYMGMSGIHGKTDDARNVAVVDASLRALPETLWNTSKAAKRLGLSRTQLYIWIL